MPVSYIPWKRRVDGRRLLVVALCLVAAFAALRFAYHAWRVLAFPYELTSGEGLVLRDALNLRHVRPVYIDPNRYPYIVSA